MTASIDLNADLGEGCPWDEALLDRVTSASVCCGAHAGDAHAIGRTLRLAAARGVVVGAHPGHADREGFGRRERAMNAAEVEALIRSQVADLAALAAQAGAIVRFLKPHGALYNQAQREEPIARGVLAAAAGLGLPVLCQPGGRVADLAGAFGVRAITEGFADRRYAPDGRLIPRSEPGAVLDDPATIAAQAVRLVEAGQVATICLHGDDPRAVARADLVRDALRRAGIEPAPFL